MRILNIPSEPVAAASAAPAAIPAAPVVHHIIEPGVTQEQFASLENIARSLLKKLEAIEERLSALESTPVKLEKSPAPEELSKPAEQVVRSFPVIGASEPPAPVVVPLKAPAPAVVPMMTQAPVVIPVSAQMQTPAPRVTVTIPKEVENIRKELFTKMWKYMTDEPSKTI